MHRTLQINTSHPDSYESSLFFFAENLSVLSQRTLFPPQSLSIIDASSSIKYFTGAVLPLTSIKALLWWILRTGFKWQTIMLTLFQICHIANVLQCISWKPYTHPDMYAHTQTLPVTSQLDVKYDIEQIIQSSVLILCLSHVQIIVEAIISWCCSCKELHIFFIISARCSLLPFQFIIPPLWSALGPDIIRENSPVVACLCSSPLHFMDWWHQ